MENLLKKIKINNMIAALLSVLTGVIFIVFRQGVADLVTRIVGGLLLAAGVLFILTYIIKKERTAYELTGLILGALLTVLGVVILANPVWFEGVVALILGIIILVNGIESVVGALSLWKREDTTWWIWLILSFVTVAAGLVIIVRRYAFSATLIMVCGIFLIYDGVTSFIVTGKLARLAKAVKQELTAIDVEGVVKDKE